MNTKVADICEDLLGRGFTIRLRVEGRSMVPTILAGAWITVVPVEHKNLKSWDILLYRNENRIVAHRLIDGLRVGYPLLLRGDACLYTESVQAI